MRVLILGGAGMLGRKLGERLAADGRVGDAEIAHLSLVDVAPPLPLSPVTIEVDAAVADISLPGVAERVIAGRPDVVFQLAAVVSGEAETDLEKGYRVNVEGMRLLLDAVRRAGDGYRPTVVFASSIAVFGAPFPETIPDEFATTPLTSYGTQKAIGELLLADYSRRGFLDGVAIRLPTICVRPGTPNAAASGFFSNIIREPLHGREAVLPVPEDVCHWFASPRAAAGYLVHAARLDRRTLGNRCCLTMPGLSVTVAEQIEALREVAGEAAVRLIRREPDERITRVVAGWPGRFDPQRALELGFRGETSFADIVRAYIDDELGGSVAAGLG
ncbi:MAG: SDR family oxidoreductase [Thermoleophilia bacterium]|nr:SDR family oxidoreductase [Thermoleophilia bacterium]